MLDLDRRGECLGRRGRRTGDAARWRPFRALEDDVREVRLWEEAVVLSLSRTRILGFRRGGGGSRSFVRGGGAGHRLGEGGGRRSGGRKEERSEVGSSRLKQEQRKWRSFFFRLVSGGKKSERGKMEGAGKEEGELEVCCAGSRGRRETKS